MSEEHKHLLIQEGDIYYCEDEDCGLDNVSDPWIIGETKTHKHQFYSGDQEGWAECHDCGIQIECDHNCDLIEDTIDHNYLTPEGVSTDTQKIMVCSRCGTIDEDYDPRDYDV